VSFVQRFDQIILLHLHFEVNLVGMLSVNFGTWARD